MQLGTGRRNHYRVHRALDPCRCTDRNRESWDRSADEMIGTKSSGNGIEKRSVVKGRQAAVDMRTWDSWTQQKEILCRYKVVCRR